MSRQNRAPMAHHLVVAALRKKSRRNPVFLAPVLHHVLAKWTGKKAIGSALVHQSKSLGYKNPARR